MPDTRNDNDLPKSRRLAFREQLDAIEAVRRELTRGDKKKAAIEQAIAGLRDLIEQQFTQEEAGGYLQSVVEQAPRLEPQVKRRLSEHQELLDQAEKLRILLHSGVDLPSWWSCLEHDFEAFVCQLSQHHRAEVELLQIAFARDVGSGD